ncbi:MAG: EthD family reductase [Pseudomonadota bacterium]
MPVSMQVAYPKTADSTFDKDYYLSTHMALVGEHMGAHIQSTVVTQGFAGGAPGSDAPFHVIATIIFADQAAMDAAMANGGPVVGDIPNFYNAQPVMMVGEVIG